MKELDKAINEWISFIEKRIAQTAFVDSDGVRKSKLEWLIEIIEQLHYNLPSTVDGNMTLARSLSLILAAWFMRISLAKSKDKRRPKEHRKILIAARKEFIKEMNKQMKRNKPEITPSMEPSEVK